MSPTVFVAKDSPIYAIDVASGAKRPVVTTAGGDKRLPKWSPDCQQVACLAGGYSGRQALYVVPRNGGTAIRIANKLDRDIYTHLSTKLEHSSLQITRMHVKRVAAGFTPALRQQVYEELKRLKTSECPFVNLPEPNRSGHGLTAEKMKTAPG